MKCLNAKTPQLTNPFFHKCHPPLPCTFHCCHGNNFTFFFSEFSLAGLTFAAPESLLEITSPYPSKDWLVSRSHCDICCSNPCSFPATACRPVTVADVHQPGWVTILLECFVCLALAYQSLQVIVQDITKPYAGQRNLGNKGVHFFFFSFLFIFHNNFKLTTVLRGKHSSNYGILVKAK